MNLTPNEVLIIALVALVVLGPKRLPVVLRRLGQLVAQVRAWTSGMRHEIDNAMAAHPTPDTERDEDDQPPIVSGE